jgi:hypothetical protein
MERDTRTWTVMCAAFCGALAIIGWIYAIYAYEETPKIHEIIFTTDSGQQFTRSKMFYLFVLPAAQTVVSLLLLPAIFRWRHNFQKLREIWGSASAVRVKIYTTGYSIVALIVLYRSVNRSLGLIHMWY